MAQMRSAATSSQLPLSGVTRTWSEQPNLVANGPPNSDIGCALRNGVDAGFSPYLSTRLNRYDAVS
jgi:hypothetical protein